MGVAIGVYYYKRVTKKSIILLYFLVASLSIDICARILGQIDYSNLILFNGLSVIEMLFFSLLYLQFIKLKQLVWLLGGIGIIYAIVETLQIDAVNITSFQPYSKMVSSFVIVTMALFYIFGQIKAEHKIAERYLNYSIICYFSLELILLLPINLLINYESFTIYCVWFSHLFINLLFYTFLIRFIWKNGKTQKQLSYG